MSGAAKPSTESGRNFRAFLNGAARLVVGRQGSAILFAGAVVTLPLVASSPLVTSFTWAYVGMLTLTSLLGFGSERLATTWVAERGDAKPATALRPLLLFRIATLPIVAVALALLFEFVDVDLPTAAFVAAVGWILVVHVEVIAASGLRALGNVTAEPVVAIAMRTAQAGLLLGLAATGAGVVTLVATLAVVEGLGAIALCSVLGSGWLARRGTTRRGWPDLRRAAAFAAIDAASLLYLRSDLLLVGHLLGATAGATYGLLYRFVDGAGGAVGTTGLWLFTNAATGRDGGDAAGGVRARAIRVIPMIAVCASVVGVACAGLVGEIVPRLAGETDTLRLLVVAFPLLAFNALELHVRSARGRNSSVLGIGMLALGANVGLCLWLVPERGLVGAAVALLAAEIVQAVAVVWTARRGERRVVVPAGVGALLATMALVGFVVALGSVIVTVTLVLAAVCVATVVGTRKRPEPRPEIPPEAEHRLGPWGWM